MEYFVSRTVLTREFIEEMYFIVLFYNIHAVALTQTEMP